MQKMMYLLVSQHVLDIIRRTVKNDSAYDVQQDARSHEIKILI
jgi:hypothetical protein